MIDGSICANCPGSKCGCSAQKKATSLAGVPVGSHATIVEVGGAGALRRRFLDMGLIPQTRVTVVKYAPMGDPMQVRVQGYELTLQRADAAHIRVAAVQSDAAPQWVPACGQMPPEPKPLDARSRGPFEREHPGLGEGGRFHEGDEVVVLPDDEPIVFALVGNPNSGKSTLFNRLTGESRRAGNFPGQTLEQEIHAVLKRKNTSAVDLPGTYSLNPYSAEEAVVCDFLLGEKPHGIINVVDATNLQRNLYLTMQLLELGMPMVVALNMMDEVAADGGSVLVNELESQLGVPVVPISALHAEGIDELLDHAVHVARYHEPPHRQDFCDPDDDGGAVHRCLHGIMHLIEDHAEAAAIPRRFAAGRIAEGGDFMLRQLHLDDNEKAAIEHLLKQMETERGLDRAAAIADMRFNFITRVCAATVVRPRESREHARTVALDRVLTGRFTAIPAFILIMLAVFWLTFEGIGAPLQDALDAGITALSDVAAAAMATAQVPAPLQSLVVDGIFSGVGSVLSFLPIVVIMFFFMSLLEDTGYMARVAFVMDKLLRKIGLSGRSIVPMLLGFGCAVPAVMASRTLPSERDRKMTVLLIPFMSCSARIPIYAFLTAVFFPDYAGLIVAALYFLGIAVGIGVAFFLKNTLFKGEAVPFVMELPNYRLPSARNVGHLVWDKAKDFLQLAFTIILLATIIIWFLQSFGPNLAMVEDSSDSLLALIAGVIAPLFAPLGLGDWRIVTSLISGFMAKESVVAMLAVLFGSTSALTALISPLDAASLLVFCLLYTPCVAAIASVKRELGGAWAFAVVAQQCTIAWVAAFAVHVLGAALGLG